MRKRLTLALLAIASLALAACGGGAGDDEQAAPMPQRVQANGSIRLTPGDRSALGLVVADAAEGDFPDLTVRFGTVVVPPGDDAQLVAPMTGLVATPPAVTVGQPVRAGTVVMEVTAVLDAPDRIAIDTQSAARDSQIGAARSELARAESEATRSRALSPQVVSAARVQAADTAVAAARANLQALERARNASAAVRDRRLPVRAPLAGTLVALSASVGMSVKSGDVVGRVLKEGPVWVDVSVPPDEPTGSLYEVLSGTTTMAARLLASGGVTERDGTRHDRLIVDAAHASRLTAGATVTVYVGHGQSRGIVLPESALVPGIDTDSVFVETAPNVFVMRAVRVGARMDGRVRIDGGVNVHEHVVVQGAMALYGERVRGQLQPS